MSLQIPVSLSLSCTGWTDQRSDRIPKILIIKILIIKLINIIILMPDTPRSLTTKWMYSVMSFKQTNATQCYHSDIFTPDMFSLQYQYKVIEKTNKTELSIYYFFEWVSSWFHPAIPAAISPQRYHVLNEPTDSPSRSFRFTEKSLFCYSYS